MRARARWSTGLCRWLAREGVSVAPFKPQNMALNSAVTLDGGEIGRAQALQAQAARIDCHSDMNPVLLKPSSDTDAQLVVHGRARGVLSAQSYQQHKPRLMEAVLQSWQRLRERYDVLIVEGAGSPAEVNLREHDIANMGFARAVQCPVVLVADIDRGGVFAQLLGTLECLDDADRSMVKGFVVNRFRGDVSLLQPGLGWLQARTARPVYGVLPYLHGLQLDAEDAIETAQAAPAGSARLTVIVPVLPRISNHTDFDALRAHPQVDLRFIGPGAPIPAADLVVLPGSKSVRADLQWLREQGWERALQRHLRYGGKVAGICGGLQMLGRAIHDTEGIEGSPGSSDGLGLLDIETTIAAHKQLRRARGVLTLAEAAVSGYEIHQGVSRGAALDQPLLRLDDGRFDGARSGDGQIIGTYLHGLFDAPDALAALLQWAGLANAERIDLAAMRERSIDRIADAVEQCLDVAALRRLIDASS